MVLLIVDDLGFEGPGFQIPLKSSVGPKSTAPKALPQKHCPHVGWFLTVLVDIPLYQRPERGYKTATRAHKNRNDGPPKPERGYKKKQNDGTNKTGTRVHLPKPPFYKTAKLFPLEKHAQRPPPTERLPRRTESWAKHHALIFFSLPFWFSLPFAFSRNSLRF